MSNKLFPEIPSFLELDILKFTGYCPICDTYVQHKLTSCKDCNSTLCLDYPGGIWKVNKEQNNYICYSCRLSRSKSAKAVTFTLVPIRPFFKLLRHN